MWVVTFLNTQSCVLVQRKCVSCENRPSGIRCPDVLIARDSLPGMPFPGALVYVDHEASQDPCHALTD